MKMIVCILQISDRDDVAQALNEAGYPVTMLPSTGAYLRRGNATMIAPRKGPRVPAASSAPIKKGRKGGISSIHILAT